MEKKKVSRFEYAIMQYADPEEAKKLEPRTEEEEVEIRKENIRRQLRRIKFKGTV
jgi:hypothetical protein